MPKYGFFRLLLEIDKKIHHAIRAKGTVADLNVYLMKVKFDWTKLTRSYLRMFLYAFKFLTCHLKIKVQKRLAKRIYS